MKSKRHPFATPAAAGRLRRRGSGRASLLRRPLAAGAIASSVIALAMIAAPALADAPPSVTVNAASAIGYSTAHLSGTVNPNGGPSATDWQLQYSTSGVEGSWNTAAAGAFEGPEAEETTPLPVAGEAEGLAPNTTYFTRILASNEEGGNTTAKNGPSFTTKEVALPTATIETPVPIGTTVHLVGHVNPDAPEAEPASPEVEAAFSTHWEFVCTPACQFQNNGEGTLAADDSSHEVSADARLQPATSYQVELIARNSGGEATATSPAFATSTSAISIASTFATTVTASGATLNAKVNPGGAAVTYRFQYVTQAQFEADQPNGFQYALETPESGLGGSQRPTRVSCSETEQEEIAEKNGLCRPYPLATQGATGLESDTPYTYRLIAHASSETFTGPAASFNTYSTASASSACPNEGLRAENRSLLLPDCRAYEQVSPSGNGETYTPGANAFAGSFGEEDIDTGRLFRAAEDGGAVAYIGDPTSSPLAGNGSTGTGGGNQWLAHRGALGWSAVDASPLGVPGSEQQGSISALFESFSADLSSSIVSASPAQVTADPAGPIGCLSGLYYRPAATGVLQSLIPETQVPGRCGALTFAGSSADQSRQFFETNTPLTPGAESAPGEFHDNLYDFASGRLSIVNVLPGGEPDPDATFGALGTPGNGPDFDHIVSSDGSRAYWTDLETGRVYLRRNPDQPQSPLDGEGHCTVAADACTVPVSIGEAQFWTATPDGRYAYYTEAGELWRFDAPSQTREVLAGPGSGVQGVIGVNESGEDGAYLYFVADAALAPGATPQSCQETQSETPEEEQENLGNLEGRGCNLFLLHSGSPLEFIATLSPRDNNLPQEGSFFSREERKGDWQPTLGMRTAELSADGRHLVFASHQALTDYGTVNGPMSQRAVEIYIYSATEPRSLLCASCQPAGAALVRAVRERYPGTYTYLQIAGPQALTYQSRSLSSNGARVFFGTAQPLVPADTNGRLDVYEWERSGAGTCTRATGCIYLLSGGSASHNAYLVDAGVTGSDVFFTTRDQLAAADHDGRADLYDARVEGGFPPSTEPPGCVGASCQAQTTPPSIAPPGTANFSGPGNPKQCSKGMVRKHAKCVKQTARTRRHKNDGHKKHKRVGSGRGGAK